MAITIDGTDGFSSDNSALKFDTSVFVIDETNNRIGVNTASPSQALDVTGDIEVSGGVYLGGTGSANYLNDYEAGTWTPVFACVTSGPTVSSYSTIKGSYIKVGNSVTVWFDVTGNITNAGSGYALIQGLPFAANNSRSGYSAVQFRNSTALNSASGYITGWVYGSNNTIYLEEGNGNASGNPLFRVTSSGRLTGFVTYETS